MQKWYHIQIVYISDIKSPGLFLEMIFSRPKKNQNQSTEKKSKGKDSKYCTSNAVKFDSKQQKELECQSIDDTNWIWWQRQFSSPSNITLHQRLTCRCCFILIWVEICYMTETSGQLLASCFQILICRLGRHVY